MNKKRNWEDDLLQRPLPNRGKSSDIKSTVQKGIESGSVRRYKVSEKWRARFASVAMIVLVTGIGALFMTHSSLFRPGTTTTGHHSTMPSLKESNYVATYTTDRVGNHVQFQVHIKKWGKGVLAVGVNKTGGTITGRHSYNEGVYFVATSTDPSKQIHLFSNDIWAGAKLLNKYMKKHGYSTLEENEPSTFSYSPNWDTPNFNISAAANGTIPLSMWRLLIVDVRQQTKTSDLSIQWVKVVAPSPN